MLTKSKRNSQFLFLFSTFLIIYWTRTRIEDTVPFLLIAGGIATFSLSLMRAINRFVEKA